MFNKKANEKRDFIHDRFADETLPSIKNCGSSPEQLFPLKLRFRLGSRFFTTGRSFRLRIMDLLRMHGVPSSVNAKGRREHWSGTIKRNSRWDNHSAGYFLYFSFLYLHHRRERPHFD